MQALRNRNGSTSTFGSESTADDHPSPREGSTDAPASPTPLPEEERIRTFETFIGSPLQRPWLYGRRPHRRPPSGPEYERLSLQPLGPQGAEPLQGSTIEVPLRNTFEADTEAALGHVERPPPPPYAKEDPCPQPDQPFIYDGRPLLATLQQASEARVDGCRTFTATPMDLDGGRRSPPHDDAA